MSLRPPTPTELHTFRQDAMRLLMMLKSDIRALEMSGCEPMVLHELWSIIAEVEENLAART